MPQVIEVPGVGPVEFPDGMTDEDIVRAIQGMEAGPQNQDWQARTRARARGIEPVNADPTADMSFLEQAFAGGGRAAYSLVRGGAQRLGILDADDTRRSRELDAPLMDSAGGQFGNFAAPLIATAPLSGLRALNTIRGATGFGAGYGALQPTESGAETATNILTGGVLGAGGQWVGNRLSQGATNWLARREGRIASQEAGDAVKQETLRRGQELGLVAPPASANPSVVNRAAGSVSGQSRTEQFASIRNQSVTNAVARRELGLAENTPLTPTTLREVRREAGQVYDDIARSGPVRTDDQLLDELAEVSADSAVLNRAYPGAADDGATEILRTIDGLMVEEVPAQAAIAMVRRQRNLANKAFRAGDNELGAAHREIAGAVEDNLMRHLRANGQEATADAFDAARRRIAIAHTVEDALNEGSGEIMAHKLAGDLRRGVPLSGDLQTIAQFAQAFRPAMQNLTKAPVSALDHTMGTLFAGGAGIGTGGNLAAIAAGYAAPAAVRGFVRNRQLGPVWQRYLMAPNRRATQLNPLAAIPGLRNTSAGRVNPLEEMLRGAPKDLKRLGPLAAVAATQE